MGTILNKSSRTERFLVCQKAFEVSPGGFIQVPAMLASEFRIVEKRGLVLFGSFDIVKGRGDVYVKKSTKEIPVPEEYPTKEFEPPKVVVPHISETPPVETSVVEETSDPPKTDLELALEADDPIAYLDDKYTKKELLEMVGVFTKVDWQIRKEKKDILAQRIIDWLKESSE